jgi:N-acetyl-anhydromuramyl-L-alanine amidase AmpD
MGTRYGVILHGSRSGRAEWSKSQGDGSEGQRTLTYVRTPGTTSYNWLIDYDGVIYELAGWDLQAWHAGHRTTSLHMNTNWYGVCFAQVDTWEPVTAAQHASAKWLLKEISQRTGIPLRKLNDVPSRYAVKGITEHRLTAQGRSGGKSDVGSGLDWNVIL